MREDEVTVRTHLAEVKAEQRAQRERLESRHADSLRRFDLHTAEDAKRFDKLDVVLDEMRGEFKAVRESISSLATSSAVTNTKVLFLVAIAGALGSAAVAVAQHMIGAVAG
jgi:hypothetical protein